MKEDIARSILRSADEVSPASVRSSSSSPSISATSLPPVEETAKFSSRKRNMSSALDSTIRVPSASTTNVGGIISALPSALTSRLLREFVPHGTTLSTFRSNSVMRSLTERQCRSDSTSYISLMIGRDDDAGPDMDTPRRPPPVVVTDTPRGYRDNDARPEVNVSNWVGTEFRMVDTTMLGRHRRRFAIMESNVDDDDDIDDKAKAERCPPRAGEGGTCRDDDDATTKTSDGDGTMMLPTIVVAMISRILRRDGRRMGCLGNAMRPPHAPLRIRFRFRATTSSYSMTKK